MSEDARFEDGREVPLNLGALDADDLQVLSALAQDAVFPVTEMTWRAKDKRFAILLNRFRWEDVDAAQTRGRDVERAAEVTIRATDLDGKEIVEEASGLRAVCLQHEFDHLDGILFIDRISRLKRSLYVKKRKKLLAAEQAE